MYILLILGYLWFIVEFTKVLKVFFNDFISLYFYAY